MAQAPNSVRQLDLYWKQLQQLKAACICIRLYRNELRRRVKWIEGIKAVGSSGGVAGWLIWRDIPFLWTTIIAASQFLDAIKNVFPISKDHKAASDLTVALEVIWIDAEDVYEGILDGTVPTSQISKRRTKLRKLQLSEERRYFPEGLDMPEKLIRLATQQAAHYFTETFGAEES